MISNISIEYQGFKTQILVQIIIKIHLKDLPIEELSEKLPSKHVHFTP